MPKHTTFLKCLQSLIHQRFFLFCNLYCTRNLTKPHCLGRKMKIFSRGLSPRTPFLLQTPHKHPHQLRHCSQPNCLIINLTMSACRWCWFNPTFASVTHDLLSLSPGHDAGLPAKMYTEISQCAFYCCESSHMTKTGTSRLLSVWMTPVLQ